MSMVMDEMVDHYKGVRQRIEAAANRHRLEQIAEAKAKAERDAVAAVKAEEDRRTYKREQIEMAMQRWADQIALAKEQMALRKRDWVAITNEIIDKRHITWRELIARDRSYRFSVARHHVWYAIRTELKFSYPQIAMKFARDHTTVMHGCQKHAQRIGVPYDQPKKPPKYLGGDTSNDLAAGVGVRRPKAVVQARLPVRDDLARQDDDAIRRSHRDDVREAVSDIERAEA